MTAEEIDEFLQGMPWQKAEAKGINGLFVLPYDTKLEILKSDVVFRKSSSRNKNLGWYRRPGYGTIHLTRVIVTQAQRYLALVHLAKWLKEYMKETPSQLKC